MRHIVRQNTLDQREAARSVSSQLLTAHIVLISLSFFLLAFTVQGKVNFTTHTSATNRDSRCDGLGKWDNVTIGLIIYFGYTLKWRQQLMLNRPAIGNSTSAAETVKKTTIISEIIKLATLYFWKFLQDHLCNFLMTGSKTTIAIRLTFDTD